MSWPLPSAMAAWLARVAKSRPSSLSKVLTSASLDPTTSAHGTSVAFNGTSSMSSHPEASVYGANESAARRPLGSRVTSAGSAASAACSARVTFPGSTPSSPESRMRIPLSRRTSSAMSARSNFRAWCSIAPMTSAGRSALPIASVNSWSTWRLA